MSHVIEKLAATIHEATDLLDVPEQSEMAEKAARSVLRDLHLTPEAALSLMEGESVVVPRKDAAFLESVRAACERAAPPNERLRQLHSDGKEAISHADQKRSES